MMQKLPDLRSIPYQQSADTEVRALLLPAAVLLYIEEGCKYVSSSDKVVHCASSGEFVFLQQNSALTVRNRPGTTGNYLAQALIFNGSGLSNHLPYQDNSADAFYCFQAPGEMVEAFTRMRAALRQPDLPEQVTQARFYKLKAWLIRTGIQISQSPFVSLTQKLRLLLAADLSHLWRGTEVATRLGMSEATLSRGLARANTSFTATLRETRLQSALEKLQTTEQSLSEIAYHTGFSSHSHFTDVFRKLFDFPPSHLRARKEMRMIEM